MTRLVIATKQRDFRRWFVKLTTSGRVADQGSGCAVPISLIRKAEIPLAIPTTPVRTASRRSDLRLANYSSRPVREYGIRNLAPGNAAPVRGRTCGCLV